MDKDKTIGQYDHTHYTDVDQTDVRKWVTCQDKRNSDGTID